MNHLKRLILALAVLAYGAHLQAESAIEGLSPQMMLIQARSMFPQEHIDITGTLETAEVRGQNEIVRPYTLTLDWTDGNPEAVCKIYKKLGDAPVQHARLIRRNGETLLTLTSANGSVTENVRLNTPVGDSDLSWVDLTFNYLWWNNVRQLSEEEISQRNLKTRQGGRNCVILEAFPPESITGLHSMLLWVDISTGYIVQTEQTDAHGKAVRRQWVQRIGREEGRWVPREFRIQRDGMRRVTKLKISTIRSSSFSVKEN
jgi:hypothetical protein